MHFSIVKPTEARCLFGGVFVSLVFLGWLRRGVRSPISRIYVVFLYNSCFHYYLLYREMERGPGEGIHGFLLPIIHLKKLYI